MIIILKIFFFSFLLNVVWELGHSLLYTTCHKCTIIEYRNLMLGQSLKDGFWIIIFYGFTVIIFNNLNILNNPWQLFAFVVLGLLFSFIDEKVSLKLKRWEYTKAMPTLFGAGLTPLLEIAVTGIIAFYIVFNL
jgi:hypothetical protein